MSGDRTAHPAHRDRPRDRPPAVTLLPAADDDHRKPWDRQPGESRQAHAALRAYLELGPTRSHVAVARELGKSATLVARWSARWGWQVRTEAYDRHLDRARDAAAIAAREEMGRRHADLAMQMLDAVAQRLSTLDGDRLRPADLARLVEVAVRVERLARGLPDRVEVGGVDGGPVVVAALTAEERRARLYELRAELDRRLDQ